MKHVWKGEITNVKDAWALTSLVKQIREWAHTEFKSFVVQHLRQWNEYYENQVSKRDEVSQNNQPETSVSERGQDPGLGSPTLDEGSKKRNREEEDEIGISSSDLKRLRSLLHPWWGMHPLYRPDSKTGASGEGSQKMDVERGQT